MSKKILKIKPTFIDLFSGAGGFMQGFINSGYDCKLSIDNWKPASDTHIKNYPKIPFLEKDIRNIDFSKFKNIDVVIGGPPCQGFSSIGKQNKKDKRNNLILNFARAVKEIRPKFFVMENVRGINNKKYQPLIAEFLKILNNSGYKNIISSVLCAADYGIPQLRYRTFFFGSLCGSELQFPKIKIKDKLKYKTLKDCIFDLEGKENSISNHIPMKHNKIVKERISYIKEGGGISKDIPKRLLKGSRSDFSNNTIQNFSHIYKRLHYGKPASTMVPGHNAFPLHPKKNRSLTVREAARIQTFSDKIEFIGTRQEQCILVGNAVPPILSKIIASHIKKYIII